jgi:hypothetical protein
VKNINGFFEKPRLSVVPAGLSLILKRSSITRIRRGDQNLDDNSLNFQGLKFFPESPIALSAKSYRHFLINRNSSS